MSIEEELERKIELSQTVLKRLDSGENLSQVLNQARYLMALSNDNISMVFLDMLIHGFKNVPYKPSPITKDDFQKAATLIIKLCSLPFSMDSDGNIITLADKGREPDVVTFSVYEMENIMAPEDSKPVDSARVSKQKFGYRLFFNRTKQILVTLRADIYNKVSSVLTESIREKDRIALFGQDYRLVTDKLNCLESPVGNELLAAADDLQSTNPAQWNSSGLICRNVILKLARLLWKVEVKTYISRDGNSHDVSRNKEKNIMLAYIDYHLIKVPPEKKVMLDEANTLVAKIYDRGSEGKRQLPHKEAQELLVDTFNFVDLLENATGLIPLSELTK
jgi:hypothetical protein